MNLTERQPARLSSPYQTVFPGFGGSPPCFPSCIDGEGCTGSHWVAIALILRSGEEPGRSESYLGNSPWLLSPGIRGQKLKCWAEVGFNQGLREGQASVLLTHKLWEGPEGLPHLAFHSQLETRLSLLPNFTWKFYFVVFCCCSEKDIEVFSPQQISDTWLCISV